MIKKSMLAVVFLLLTAAQMNADDMKNKTSERTETHSETFLYEKQLNWENAGEHVTRQIMGYNGDIMLVKVKFEKNAVGTPHRHPHTQTTYIVSGKFKFTVDGKTQIVGPGDGVFVAPNVLHGCVCLEPGVLIDCFNPARADFLKK